MADGRGAPLLSMEVIAHAIACRRTIKGAIARPSLHRVGQHQREMRDRDQEAAPVGLFT